ncbi:DUF2642 domain-containing protein [Halobacillus litoralis]|uniref:DUF2642 domain-containing protein n=1 Tax=Halobacillus litoralis TaxID=45668 RepID=UPI00248FC132|nr:DUF2642 domain-containing protein [Halobacillus litoralis]
MSLLSRLKQRIRLFSVFNSVKRFPFSEVLTESIGTILIIQTIDYTLYGKVDMVGKDYILLNIGDRVFSIDIKDITNVLTK